MYKKPTQEQIKYGIDCGWTKEEAERGYTVMTTTGGKLLEICRIDCIWVGWGEDGSTEVDDDDCSIEAERSGFCKIIPVEELPENFEYRYFGWVDTPENRAAIQSYCEQKLNV